MSRPQNVPEALLDLLQQSPLFSGQQKKWLLNNWPLLSDEDQMDLMLLLTQCGHQLHRESGVKKLLTIQAINQSQERLEIAHTKALQKIETSRATQLKKIYPQQL